MTCPKPGQSFVLAAVLVGSASGAMAQPTTTPTTAAAQARFEAGSKAYTGGDFAKASAEFAAGYAAEPWSGFLFAWAQADRRRGACDTAVPLYERFIATDPPAAARTMATDAIAACGGKAPEPKPPKPPEPRVIVVREPAQPRDVPPHSNALAYALGGAGLVAAGLGAGFYVLARRDARDADRAATLPDAAALFERAEDRLLISRIAVGAGAALVIAGALRFTLHRPVEPARTSDRRGRTRRSAAVAILPVDGGASLFVTLR